MQRRSFLKFSSLTFTSLLGPIGCRAGTAGHGSTSGQSGTSGDTGGREVVEAPERFPQSIASGDPKPSSVIVWTRVEHPEHLTDEIEVEVEVWPLTEAPPDEPAADSSGGASSPSVPDAITATVVAEAAFDHCVKIKVEGLMPYTEYGYRFIVVDDGVAYASRTGRTRTAPAPDADVPVRFAFVSCQDYGGRYYNAYAALAQQPLDFFVHLGDYIYETTGDSSFQEETIDRSIAFDDEAGAIALTGHDGSTFYAARSLDNYRQLYRVVRRDAALQRTHEQIPMVAIWDDHEFSDDAHGSSGTYFDGRVDESDPARRAAANQAWFEYMPVDYPDPDFVYRPQIAPPDDIRIYRDLEFGRHVHLVMTDLRSYRPDHLIAEDAYPGAIAVQESALLGIRPDATAGVPYVDLEIYAEGAYVEFLQTQAEAEGYDPARVLGPTSAIYINERIAATESALAPIDAMELETLPRGIAFHQMFKTNFFDQLGSRYLVIREPFLIYAQWRNDESGGDDQSVMGAAQQQWFLDRMQNSTHTWKIWGNEFCLTGLDIDLRTSALPEPFRHIFQMSAEDWNGFPHRRAELIDALAPIDNVVAITGDIHAFFAGTPFGASGAREGARVVEFVTGSITSGTYQSLLVGQVQSSPSLAGIPGIELFAQGIRDLLLGGANPNIGFAETAKHGFAVVTATAEELLVDYHMHPESLVMSARYDDPSLLDEFRLERFRVAAGSRDLYRDIDGTWRRWDPIDRIWA